MRKRKQFTPSLIRRLRDEGRGTGVHLDFTPLHRVRRSEPASSGTSAIVPPRGQFSTGQQLSLAEQIAYEFCSMVEHLDDLRLQVRLEIDRHLNCLHDYSQRDDEQTYPGTNDICHALGIRRPALRQGADVEDWIHSTDLVLTTKAPFEGRRLLAVSVKDDALCKLSKRKRQLLSVERDYWLSQGHNWLLITPETYCPRVGEAIMRSAGFVHGHEPLDDAHLERTADLVKRVERSLIGHLYNLMDDFRCSMSQAQTLFWQAVWNSRILVDWRHTLWASNAVRLVSKHEFQAFNPVISGRSAWPT